MRDCLTKARALARLFAGFALLIAAAGCAAFGEGVGRSVIGYVQGEDDAPPSGFCRIEGRAFGGLEEALARADASDGVKTVRVLIVHGIGPHDENYSLRLTGMIADTLGLDRRDRRQKRVHLANAPATGGAGAAPVGRLLISRFTNADASRELLTFEVNWSALNEESREQFVSDDADIDRVRASVNASMKTFLNRQSVDPIKYIGDQSPFVHDNVRLGACWMISAAFDDYPHMDKAPPETVDAFCPALSNPERARAILDGDEFAAITHSLGSRIFVDAFSTVGEYIDLRRGDAVVNPFVKYETAFADKRASVFMLSNQLMLLQLGLDTRGLRGPDNQYLPLKNSERWPGADRAAFCAPDGMYADERRFGGLSIVAVTDPNDLLSYRIPEEFADEFVDRRLCARVTNATVEIAPKRDLFGLSFADPMTAHNAYWSDPRVAALIVRGFDPRHGEAVAGADSADLLAGCERLYLRP